MANSSNPKVFPEYGESCDESRVGVDSGNHGAAHAHSHLLQLLLPERSGKESFLFFTTKDLIHCKNQISVFS